MADVFEEMYGGKFAEAKSSNADIFAKMYENKNISAEDKSRIQKIRDGLGALGSNPLVRGAYGLAEGATNLLTGMGASAVGGIEGINKLLSGGSAGDATGRIQEIQDKYTYQPRTAEGAASAHVAGLPLELAGKAGAYAGRNSEIAQALGVTDAAESIGEVVPAVAATLLMGRSGLNGGANRPNVTNTANDPFLQAKSLREAGNDSMRLDSIAKAKEAGLILNPMAVRRILTNKVASTVIGDTALDKAVSTKNKPVMTAMVKDDIGVSNGTPLSPEVLNARMAEAAKPYEELRGVNSFKPDGKFQSEVAAMNDFSGHSPAVQDFLKQNAPKLQAEVQAMAEGGFNGNDVVTLMQKFRKEANSVLSNKAQQSPEALALANAQRTAAKAIEGMVDRNLAAAEQANPGQGFGDLAQRFRDGRTTIAKIKTAEPFIDGNGNFVPTKAFRLSKNNASYTGNFKILSDVSGSFPDSFNPAPLSGGALNVSHSGILNSIRHLVSDPLERYVLSDRYQQKNMSGLDPRDARTRLGYGEPPTSPRTISINKDIPYNGLPSIPNAPLLTPDAGRIPPNAPQARTPLPAMSEDLLPIAERYQGTQIPIGTIEAGGPAQARTPFPTLPPQERGLLSLEDPVTVRGSGRRPPEPSVDYRLRQEVLQQPEIVSAINNFRQQAKELKQIADNARNPKVRAQAAADLEALRQEFAAGMKQIGSENAGDATGLSRKLNEGGRTQRTVQKTFDPRNP